MSSAERPENGKGSAPRKNLSEKFRKNFDSIKWSKSEDLNTHPKLPKKMSDTPRTDAYYAGKGCECSAHNWSECGCGVDWTDPRIYELQAEVERLKGLLSDLLILTEKNYWNSNNYKMIKEAHRAYK